MPVGSPWEQIGRHMITDYANAYEDCDFILPRGPLTCAWSYRFTSLPTLDRQTCHNARLERLLPLLLCADQREYRFALDGAGVVLAGLDADEHGLLVRLLNLHDTPQPFTLELPFTPVKVTVTSAMSIGDLTCGQQRVTGILPPQAIRELYLFRH
jgi:hypothetical protein